MHALPGLYAATMYRYIVGILYSARPYTIYLATTQRLGTQVRAHWALSVSSGGAASVEDAFALTLAVRHPNSYFISYTFISYIQRSVCLHVLAACCTSVVSAF